MVRETATSSSEGRNCDLVLEPGQLADQFAGVVGEQDETAVHLEGLEGQTEHPLQHLVHGIGHRKHPRQPSEEAKHPMDVALVADLLGRRHGHGTGETVGGLKIRQRPDDGGIGETG